MTSEDATGDRSTALPLAGRPVPVGEGAGGVKNGSELLVEVRAGEIKKGRRKNCKLCPVALAVRRAAVSAGIMKEFYEGNEILMPWASVYVSHGWISFGGIGCKAPACVGRFIEAFDEGKRVRPFAFTLELPEANK